MPRVKHKAVKFTPREMAAELPAELDFSKLRSLGRGPDAIERAARRKVVPLDADVAKVFGSAKDVNDALRGLIHLANQSAGRRAKTA